LLHIAVACKSVQIFARKQEGEEIAMFGKLFSKGKRKNKSNDKGNHKPMSQTANALKDFEYHFDIEGTKKEKYKIPS